jgi:hypothetical protein
MTERPIADLPRVGMPVWLVLWTVALVAHLAAALWIPNAEQDGYSYAEIISQWSSALSSGRFRLADLFGFWLPLFPFAAAIPNIWMGNALLVGKILSALCGATSCLLVFAIVRKLTRNLVLSALSFAILVSSPLYLLYSAACMTDVPEACLILASLWFVLHKRWIAAALIAAVAEGVRLESWVLVIALPALQVGYERRISVLSLTILLVPPLAWLAISQLATGDPLAFFAKRARYQQMYMDFYPTRHGFTFSDVRRDFEYFLLGANRGVVLAGSAAGILSLWRALQGQKRVSFDVATMLTYAVAFAGLISLAYLTKRQPVLLPRYGLLFFGVGLPLFMWLLRYSFQPWQRWWIPKLISAAAIVLCLWEAKRQVPTISKVFADYRAHRQIAGVLTAAIQQWPSPNQRCFSDNPAVRILSQLPADRFVRSESAPRSAWEHVSGFESYLRENDVGYLVFTEAENSLPTKFYRDLGRRSEESSSRFQFVAFAPSPFAPDIWLFRVRGGESAAVDIKR